MIPITGENGVQAQALTWALRLAHRCAREQYRDGEGQRNLDFCQWVTQSLAHLRWFMVYLDVQERLRGLDEKSLHYRALNPQVVELKGRQLLQRLKNPHMS
jgi:steroid 5-alpha reductase family enzyme